VSPEDEVAQARAEAEAWRARFEAERLARLAAEAEAKAATRAEAAASERLAETESVLARELEAKARELAAAQRASEDAGRTKTAFLANMSHEIRTPLSAVMGYANLIAAVDHVHPETREWSKRLQRSAEHLLALLDDVLDLAKIESGKFDLHLVPTEPSTVLEEVGVLMEPRAVEKGLEFLVISETDLPAKIRTDPLRLRQILVNLVGNAVKYTQRGKVAVHARMRTSPVGRSLERVLEFDVADTGVGIPRAELGRLFLPFEQGAQRPRVGGVGLGLDIARRLARMLGGNIDVRSEVGVGSVFTLSLPVDAGLDRVTTPARLVTRSGALRPDEPEAPRLDGLTVLVVDDTEDNRRIIAHFLRSAGAKVIEVATLASARRVVQDASSGVGIVLCDLQLTDGDGLALVSELRLRQDRRPIIALTADAMLETRERAIAAGVDDFMVKPIVAWRLVSRVAALTRKSGSRPGTPRPQRRPAEPEAEAADPQVVKTPPASLRPVLRRAPTLPGIPRVEVSLRDPQRIPTAPSGRPPSPESQEQVDVSARPEVPDELLLRFYGVLAERAHALDEALRERDRAKVRDIAHRVAGSGGTMGHPELTTLGREVDTLASRDEPWEQVEGPGRRLLATLRDASTRRPWLR
jgi:signal transduction histidine kinase/DNA-binding response OmpR family regulator/HPt (histidine-containing phosphotransfer) domain-containing protein